LIIISIELVCFVSLNYTSYAAILNTHGFIDQLTCTLGVLNQPFCECNNFILGKDQLMSIIQQSFL